jgi:formylglycine-generating enzyme required for sulfatase activity
MRLSGKQVEQLQDALLAAFSKDALRMLVRTELDQNLDEIAGGENLRILTFNLVSWAEQNSCVGDLLQAAYKERPRDAVLQRLIQSLSPPSQLHTPAGRTSSDARIAVTSLPASIDLFLSYNRHDSSTMRPVREALHATGLTVWTDEGLEAGTPSWRAAIEEAIRQAKAMVVLLSPAAKSSVWVDNEVAYAQALDKPVFPILVAGDIANAVPINLIRVQWIDGRQDAQRAVERELQPLLLRHIGHSIAKTNSPIAFDWVVIPAGTFLMGSSMRQDPQAAPDEAPQHRMTLLRFCISRVPVTNGQYSQFVLTANHPRPAHWNSDRAPDGREQHPVVNVSWYDAQAFCRWADVQLPTEAQWEKAARGVDGRFFPWGDHPPDPSRCNYDRVVDDTTPVGTYRGSDSPYGIADLAGNVLEWTQSLWGPDIGSPQFGYPYDGTDGRENPDPGRKVLCAVRGGAFNLGASALRCACRMGSAAGRGRPNIGFRVICATSEQELTP